MFTSGTGEKKFKTLKATNDKIMIICNFMCSFTFINIVYIFLADIDYWTLTNEISGKEGAKVWPLYGMLRVGSGTVILL